MKKLFGIIIISLLLSSKVYALDVKLDCNFLTRTNSAGDFISEVFIDIKGENAYIVIDTNFTYKRHTTWQEKVYVNDNDIIIGLSWSRPYFEIDRYSLSTHFIDHQGNTHKGKCKKSKKKI